MKLTNRYGLPQAIVDAVARDDYSREGADISVSQLVAPPRLVTLAERHADEIVEDASERIWALLGKSVHSILAQAGQDALTEERLHLLACPLHSRIGAHEDILKTAHQCPATWHISGAFDSLMLAESDEGWLLTDWKVTSAWTRVFGSRLADWEASLNLYALLLKHHGFNVTDVAIGAIYRDWSQRDAERSQDYPKVPAETIPMTLWPIDDQDAYLLERVRLHQEARRELPECTPEDRWARPDTWAVMREGRQSALRVFGSKQAAEAWVVSEGLAMLLEVPNTDEVYTHMTRGISIQHRLGESARCKERPQGAYCPALPFCDQASVGS